ncbi:hypothetical protein, partial [Klebsiella pneumoniae]|uniref:hypothetical protein n=1 Tax=Klebsiella pneumoniae TaxID=573 RepID=UPI003F5CE171
WQIIICYSFSVSDRERTETPSQHAVGRVRCVAERAYAQRKAEKENDPRHIRQRKLTRLAHDLMSESDPEL